MLWTTLRSGSRGSAWGSRLVCLLRCRFRTCCRGVFRSRRVFAASPEPGHSLRIFACFVAEIGPHRSDRPRRFQLHLRLLSSPRRLRSLWVLSRFVSPRPGYRAALTLHPECCPTRLPQVDFVRWCSAGPMPKRSSSPGQSSDAGAMVPNAPILANPSPPPLLYCPPCRFRRRDEA